jgi:23S rRNA pseudouridine1911/1915/1917 synthase
MNKNEIKKPYKRKPREGQIKEYKVYHDCELMAFLIEKMPKLSRNNIKSLLSNHQVSIDGAPISQYNFKLTKEDTVIVSKNRISRHEVKKDNLQIIYEDEDFIAINKPSGLLSIASDKEKCRTAYRMLTDYVQAKDRHNRIFVLHRLDEDTSGVLVVTKNVKVRDALQNDWSNLVKSRGYYAIVEGHLKEKNGVLRDYLKENKNNMMYITDDKKHGKMCVTSYKVMAENQDYSLLNIHLDTGRKNQIRVQLGHIGHYVVGDDKYGEPSNPLHRLGLHAYELVFVNPLNKKTYEFRAKMPSTFQSIFPQKTL